MREALVELLPMAQAVRLVAAFIAAHEMIDKLCQVGRSWLGARMEELDADTMRSTRARVAIDEMSKTTWAQRMVQAGVVLWMHRRRSTGRASFVVDGFCQAALTWLVPKANGQSWSRSALWRSSGPFLMIAGTPQRPGRPPTAPSGIGLFVRRQQAAHRAEWLGPRRDVKQADGTVRSEQWALGEHRYDSARSGPSALELALRGNAHARMLVELIAPWLLESAEVDPRDRVAPTSLPLALDEMRGLSSEPIIRNGVVEAPPPE